jgi:transposase-like protein
MCTCKKCGSNSCRKNGIPNGKQRYKCKICGLNFIEGDKKQENVTSEDIKKQADAKKIISENQKAAEKITTVNEANLPSKTLKKNY